MNHMRWHLGEKGNKNKSPRKKSKSIVIFHNFFPSYELLQENYKKELNELRLYLLNFQIREGCNEFHEIKINSDISFHSTCSEVHSSLNKIPNKNGRRSAKTEI